MSSVNPTLKAESNAFFKILFDRIAIMPKESSA